MYSKRKVKQIEKKIMETWTMCGTVTVHSKDELSWLYNEKDMYSFYHVLKYSPNVCMIEKEDGSMMIDWIPF